MVEIISVHMPKTAGTAFRHVLVDVYGSQGVLGDYPPDNSYNPNEPISDKVKAIHGHFSLNKYEGYFNSAKRIVWLRHPIFRIISEYFFAKTVKNGHNSIHDRIIKGQLGILEFAETKAMQNLQSRMIQGTKLKDFAFVGLQEFYFEDLQELKEIMQWSNFKITVENVNTYPEYQTSLQEILSDRKLMNQLASLNDLDMELYQEALNLRAQRRNESKLLQSTLADWNRTQFILGQMQQKLQELDQTRYWLLQNNKIKELKFLRPQTEETAQLLRGFHVDAPPSPISLNSDSLIIKGWVIGKKSTAALVTISHNGKILAKTPVNKLRPDVAQVHSVPGAESSGFEIAVVVTGIPLNSQLILEAILEDRSKVKIGAIQAI